MRLKLVALCLLLSRSLATAEVAPVPSALFAADRVEFRLGHSQKVMTVTETHAVHTLVAEIASLRSRPWKREYIKHGCFVKVRIMSGAQTLGSFTMYEGRAYSSVHGQPQYYTRFARTELQSIRGNMSALGYPKRCD